MVGFVWFDLGYTLLYKPREQAYQKVLASFGHSRTVEELEKAYHLEDKCFMRHYPRVFGHDPDTFMPWFLGQLNYRLGLRLDLCATWARLKAEQDGGRGRWMPFDSVRDVLSDLGRRGVRLGVISNWDHTAREILEHYGLVECFEHIIVSSEVGCEKPDPAIFDLAMRRARVSPGQCLYVGDNYYVDTVGARGAGMQCLIVNRFGTLGVEEIRDQLFIPDVSRIVDHLS
jgi:putative hydrolase of the HAD superfamily